jgi:anti-sigma B factor antagonist
MAKTAGLYEIERAGATVVLTPLTDLRELDYREIESGAKEVLALLGGAPPVKNVVLDFHKTDFYGSTALGFFVKLWKRVRAGGGNMAFCHLSAHELEVLRVTKLDKVWPVCATRAEALAAVEQASAGP